ncbi:MAG: sensor histidine kinase [Sulfuritalea sp.]|jgi:signal transduction histidine kinase|nr:sensor histidine kinase [Sulfuritalea sp.]
MYFRLARWIILLCWSATALAGGLPVAGLALLEDVDGSETIASVTAAEAAGRFRPLNQQLNAGYTHSTHWLRFTVQPPVPGEWWLEVQPPFLDDIRLYEPLPASPGATPAFREQRGGDHQPFATREIAYRAFVARVNLPDTEPRTFYLRLQTTSTSMAFLRLWQPREFQQAAAMEYLLLGLFYGLMATVLVLNLLYWAWLRDSFYGYFSLHVLILGLLYSAVNGFVSQFMIVDDPMFADRWLGFFLFASFSAGSPVYRRMLHVERDRPWLFLLFRVQMVLPLLLMASLFTDLYSEAIRMSVMLMLPVICVYVWLAYGLWRAGQRDGAFLLVGSVVVALGSVPLMLTMLGIYPGDLWMVHSRQITQFVNILAVQLAVIAHMRDTEAARHEAEARAHQAEIRAETEGDAQREHRQFIAMLTHELRTPLSVIDGAVQSLEYLHQPEDGETRLRYRRIRRSVGRINGLVSQFLAKDRVDDARLRVRPASLDGVALARLAVDSCVEGATDRVGIDAPAALPFRGDAALVQVALVNLLDNALKYSPPASEVGMLVEAMERQGQAGVAWTVFDGGAGITSASWDEVFGKYVRGEDHGHVSGAGLGLYLVRRIAELHGGVVEILEREGWGAVLRLWLPLQEKPQ